VTSIDSLQSKVYFIIINREIIVRDSFNLETFDSMTIRRLFIKFKVNYIIPNSSYRKSFAEMNSLNEKQLGPLIHDNY
jgi:hypothetical protein